MNAGEERVWDRPPLSWLLSLWFVGGLVVVASVCAPVAFWAQSRSTIKAGPAAPVVAGVLALLLLLACALLFREKERPALALATLLALIWVLVVSFAALYYAN